MKAILHRDDWFVVGVGGDANARCFPLHHSRENGYAHIYIGNCLKKSLKNYGQKLLVVKF